MRSISDTIGRLERMRNLSTGHTRSGGGRLSVLTDFGSNPGSLAAHTYAPADLQSGSPLVVVLHGCTQNATDYDIGSGWSKLADDAGFGILFPEQPPINNQNRCFNWFARDDIRRDRGEVHSIKQMIDSFASQHSIDPDRIFITGLSAGGAMALAMLAAYPEVFAAGAVVGGLPYGTASSVPEAFDRMRGHGLPGSAALTQHVRSASSHEGPWPALSIWHGTQDKTVDPANVAAMVNQWKGLHQLDATPTHLEKDGRLVREVWRDRMDRVVIETNLVNGMGHGTPLSTEGPQGYGRPGPFMLETGLSSTLHIARFFGLVDSMDVARKAPHTDAATAPSPRAKTSAAPPVSTQPSITSRSAGHPPSKIGQIIEKALRSAGLMN
ncbi:poly(hydroxyalkanoate) depolymerase family esterase [Rhodoligotrophos appendicifer]|uniref:extracellular catalytic domain type 1 short-chain-length polyhydroxyalkanoate depolymerase n=1 Tax=Rhodoligotrophos appendicifer TaxID=987056 RepID=UPI0011856FC0|nr:PHB depolymerase family esterase [Rhodoligotrophos appendicifer]